jgi:TonB family protein
MTNEELLDIINLLVCGRLSICVYLVVDANFMKQRATIFIGFLFQLSLCFSQSPERNMADQPGKNSVSQLPEFPGGGNALRQFLRLETTYPKQAKEEAIEGIVWIGFVVCGNGKIKDIKVVKGIHKVLDDEAVRVIGSMPDWRPGKDKDKPIDSYVQLPIKWSIGGSGTSASKYYNKGVESLKQKNYADAIENFNLCLKKSPTDMDALYNRGVCSIILKDTIKACEYWRLSRILGDEEIQSMLTQYCK